MEEYALMALLSAIITNISNVALSERQSQKSEDMMDKQNQYNLPENQVKRLQDAGINPSGALMSNGLTVAGNTSSPYTGYQLPEVLDPMTLVSNSMLAHKQAGLAGEQGETERTMRDERLRNLMAQTSKYEEEIKMLGLDEKAQMIANEYASALNEASLAKTKSEIDNLNELTRKYSKEIEQIEAYITQKLPEELRNLVEQRKLNVLNQQEVVAEIKRIHADTNLKEEQAGLTRLEGVTQKFEQDKLDVETDIASETLKGVEKEVQFYLDTYDDRVEQVANEAKLSKKQLWLCVVNSLAGGVSSAGIATGGAGALIKAIGK